MRRVVRAALRPWLAAQMDKLKTQSDLERGVRVGDRGAPRERTANQA
jgi:hypothetical protein